MSRKFFQVKNSSVHIFRSFISSTKIHHFPDAKFYMEQKNLLISDSVEKFKEKKTSSVLRYWIIIQTFLNPFCLCISSHWMQPLLLLPLLLVLEKVEEVKRFFRARVGNESLLNSIKRTFTKFNFQENF